MSLNTQINETIKNWHGDFTLDDLANWCKKTRCKTATIERELRPSASPHIVPVWTTKGVKAIVGYRYSETPNLPFTAPQTPQTTQSTCCASSTFYKDKNGEPIHSRECSIKNLVKEKEGLF